MDICDQDPAPIQLLDAVRHHRELEHQINAWQMLQASLTGEQLAAFAHHFRPQGPVAGAVTIPTATATTATGAAITLAVPYYPQGDSRTGQGPRMCFSSTCAMAAAFLRPGYLDGDGQPDDRYLAIVQRYGDTTEASAQVQALAALGITARLRTDGRIEHLVQQLQRGLPVPVGWLHRGPVQAPSGGGHWSLVIGWEEQRQQLRIHDPNGEADLVGGFYRSDTTGNGQLYSLRNWGRRWMVEGDGTGWWLELEP